MNISGLPALTDTYENYIWVLDQNHEAWVIDPSESQPVLDFLEKHQLALKGILLTHMHHDHVAGVAELLAQFPKIPVIGGQNNPFPLITNKVTEMETVNLWSDYVLKVLNTPGHTEEHISFVQPQHLFCGDVLFTAGAGRILNKGNAKQYHQSIQKLLQLEDEVEFYCAHEYTQSNLEFAQIIDPQNSDLQQRVSNFKNDYPLIKQSPLSTLGLEKKTNPFMRYHLSPIKETLIELGASDNGPSLFQTLRDYKDQFDRGELN